MMTAMRHSRALLALVALAIATGAFHAPANAAYVERTVFVPRNVIYPGDEITADALMERKFVRQGESRAVFGENPADLIGKVSRRTLLPGELIPNSAIHDKDLIIQGRTYKLIYNSEFVSIVGTGVPLQSASAGEMVNVRNPDTGVVIKARVQADQTLTVDDQ
jgi:flagella basal body P-ring formation protein FlgA